MPNTGLKLISRGWRWPRRAAGLALAIALAVGIAAGVIFIPNRGGSAQAASSHPSVPSGAATVQRRDLVETDTESGTLSYANSQTVYNNASGTITWLPSVGQVIQPGKALFKVDDQPVLLMDGTTPAYRELSAADSPGSDIRQLNRDLVKLGFNPDGIVVNGQWQAATTAGVEELQTAHDMPVTGTLTLGQVVFLPGPQLVGTLDATIGSGGGGSSSSSGSSGSSGSSSSSGTSGSSGSASEIMQTSSTRLVATVDLDASKQSEAKVGEKVTVEMPNGSTVNGTITGVSPVAQSSSNSDNSNGSSSSGNSNSGSSANDNGSSSSGATIPVTVGLSGRHTGAGLDQAAVSVNFAQAQAKNVLSVPVTALVATSGSSYAVQEASASHKLIPVTVGLFAAGYVQISGSGLYPGLAVTDSQG